MPTPGLSLVGFMTDQPQAIQHLRVHCVPIDPSDVALVAEWRAAAGKLGPPIANAGAPDVQPIPAAGAGYIQTLTQQAWVQEACRRFGYVNADFKLVEIDPLLAYQFVVDGTRADQHCGALNAPTVTDLLPICLPHSQPKPPDLAPLVDQMSQAQTAVLKVRNLNMRSLHQAVGIFGVNENGYESWVAGIQIHVTLPFVHVVRYNGRHYLHNGYHRCFGVRRAGATHVPCLIRDAATPQEVGIMDQTFQLALLQSGNPPTLGHFTQGRAHDVQIRAISRIIHVSWSQSALPDEYERMNP